MEIPSITSLLPLSYNLIDVSLFFDTIVLLYYKMSKLWVCINTLVENVSFPYPSNCITIEMYSSSAAAWVTPIRFLYWHTAVCKRESWPPGSAWITS